MNAWELILILAVAFTVLMPKYGLDVRLMPRDKRTVAMVVTTVIGLYVAWTMLFHSVR